MNNSTATAKARLRREIRARLERISPADRAAGSAQICARLKALKCWSDARCVLLFAPLSDEPDVWPLLELALQEKKLVALPGFDSEQNAYVARQVSNALEDLCIGRFGVREPRARCAAVALNGLDLVLVPGVAFDAHGRRLGRGKGFYDRLLSGVRGTKCGIAFDEQIVSEVPVGPHDIHLNCILTPTRWIET